MQRSARVFHVVARGMLLFVAAVVPLVYLPWTFDVLEVNKQTVLVIGVIVAALCWLGASVAERRILFRRDWLFAALAAFLFSGLISGLLSSSPYLSLVGHSEQEYTSVLSYVVFGALFFLGAHYFADAPVQRRLGSWMLVVSGIVSLLSLPAFFGTPLFTTNLVGTPTPWALYLVIMTIFGSGLWLTSRHGQHDVLPAGVFGGIVRGGFAITVFTTLLAVLAIDATVLWVALLSGMGLLFVFAFIRAHEFPQFGRFIVPMLFFVSALLFIFVPSFTGSPFVPEVSPSHVASWDIATSTLQGDNLLFGSGPGTFVFDYTQYRAVELNAMAQFWDVRFDRASSHILTLLATYGVVGTLLYVLFLIGLFSTALSRLLTEQQHDAWKLTFVPFAAWFALAVAQFFSPMNFTLQTVFWILSSVLAGQIVRELVDIHSAKSPRAALSASFGFVVILVGLVATLFITISRYSAEVAFARAVAADQTDAALEDVILDLDRAALRNRWSDVYYRNLGHALLLKTAEVIATPDADPTHVQELIGASINAAKRATELSPDNVVNWQLLGDIYREVSPLIGEADAFAVVSYERAVALAPNNPKYLVSLARGYIAQADVAARLMESDDTAIASTGEATRTEALARAAQTLTSAQSLKSDYAPARYYLGLVYERQGKLADAIASMETLRDTSPLDIGISLQLSLLYMRQGKSDLAKAELQRALEIEPNYANAHWYLASIYQQEKDFDAAIAEIEAIRKLDPDNAAVAQRLEQLQQGLAESQIPEPIEEAPDGGVTEETVNQETGS